MRLPENIADLLIERQAYRVCRLLSADEFTRFCTDRGLRVDRKRLKKLERLGLFFPMLRICSPDQVHKVEYVDGGKRYRDLGPIEEGEVWTGDTRTELAGFDFNAKVIRSWREHGFAWDPRTVKSQHVDSLDTDHKRYDAFYSQFQVEELHNLLQALTLRVEMEFALEDDGITPSGRTGSHKAWMVEGVRHLVAHRTDVHDDKVLGPLCQLISDRYYPKTQTDKRQIRLSINSLGERTEWDWYEYSRKWDALDVVKLFDLTGKQLKRIYETLSIRQQHIDPIAEWHSLVQFISVDKRQRLKGDALKAMTLREMAQMVRMLHRDAFGEQLPAPNEVAITIIHRIPDVDPDEDPLRALELVANDFGVNPRSKLVLLLEGATEKVVIPIILDRLFGATSSVFGIELVDLGGVSNAAGGKENPFSAVWRLIDYLHHHQTIVVVLMDNEGFAARNLRMGLPRKMSTYFRDRHATRPEYVKIWRLSFELDNFDDAELAKTLSTFGRAKFSQRDVARCRTSAKNPTKQGTAITIDTLYQEKIGKRLDKPAFACALVDTMFDPATRRIAEKRPIARFLVKIVKLAKLNFQPVTHTMWEYNQRSGYFGTLRPGAAARRKDPFGRPRRRKRSRAVPQTTA
jgi:hypothetical protein